MRSSDYVFNNESSANMGFPNFYKETWNIMVLDKIARTAKRLLSVL